MNKEEEKLKKYGDYLIGKMSDFTFSEYFTRMIRLKIEECYVDNDISILKIDLIGEYLNDKINAILSLTSEDQVDNDIIIINRKIKLDKLDKK
jgi:hypothetical protein